MTDNTPRDLATEDPVIDFLSALEINSALFKTLDDARLDQEKYNEFFNTPDLYVLLNLIQVMDRFDPNKTEAGEKDHNAYINLIKWFMIKYALDPVWMCYIGHFMRWCGCHQHNTSYWPIRYNDRFNPNYFYKRGEDFSFEEENKKFKDPIDIFGIDD